MPGMSGIELCEYIRCNYPKTVVIVMSGNQEEAYETAATQRGALGFLRKPFEGRAILEIVRAALVKRGSAEESERF
jgi:DNA-binding response OmpR family regulator